MLNAKYVKIKSSYSVYIYFRIVNLSKDSISREVFINIFHNTEERF